MTLAATSTGIQSTLCPGNKGTARMEGCKEVANRMGHISVVGQLDVSVEPQSWPVRSRVVGIFKVLDAVWVMRSTGRVLG